ncbi:MAG: hypothetical protein L3K19_09685 [Thermoplasmata archaeon]|nr:hypothetical protein [Thermoplasmata archaeon]
MRDPTTDRVPFLKLRLDFRAETDPSGPLRCLYCPGEFAIFDLAHAQAHAEWHRREA